MTELIAYLHGRENWQVADIHADELTYINYAFAKVKDGTISASLPNLDRLRLLRQKFPKLKVVVSIGGWAAEGFSDGVATADNRQVLAVKMLRLVTTLDLDGIDLDWEYPGFDLSGIKSRSDDVANFERFLALLQPQLQTLSQKLQRPLVLTAAVGADPTYLNALCVNGRPDYAQYLDWLNVMTYDMRGSWTHRPGHQANLFAGTDDENNLSVNVSVTTLLRQGIPATKIVIGAAAYSRDWRGVKTTAANPFLGTAKSTGDQMTAFKHVQALLNAHPEFTHWDERAQAPYYFDWQLFMSYDDPRSMTAKMKYVLNKHLRGLMMWEIALDPADALLGAAAAVLRKS